MYRKTIKEEKNKTVFLFHNNVHHITTSQSLFFLTITTFFVNIMIPGRETDSQSIDVAIHTTLLISRFNSGCIATHSRCLQEGRPVNIERFGETVVGAS